ncbi:hypothetical protein L596_014525 [Steinernema carpocapsae]|uniref:THAP-type domain-containing protein n=1 Tax=Steinernema carpocapsae TaxID=34508 RepID=A0A4U5NCQ4_STECR|nr:hypothetical protein L596_014525 [Steinernema carpocapsae]
MPRGHPKAPPQRNESIILANDGEEYVLLEESVDGVIEDEEPRFEALIDGIEEIFQNGEHVVLEADGTSGPATLIADEHVRSCCIVCHRVPSAAVRLFRWPRDPEVRKNWCRIFGLSLDSVETSNAFICSWHFEPDQFVCYGEKIFWAPNARPSFVLERSFHGDFVYPWQTGYISSGSNERPDGPVRSQNDPKGLKRKNRPPPPGIQIFFRDSHYKIKGKQTHPVAILPIPSNPDQFYEFSLNRKSSDGTGFYACLQCRKAKADSEPVLPCNLPYLLMLQRGKRTSSGRSI